MRREGNRKDVETKISAACSRLSGLNAVQSHVGIDQYVI